MLKKIAIQFILLLMATQSYALTLQFDSPNEAVNWGGYIWDNVRKKKWTTKDRVNVEIANGVLRFKAKAEGVDPSGAYACLVVGGFDEVDPQECPVVEMKFRTNWGYWPVVFTWLSETQSGKQYDHYKFYPAEAYSWRTVTFRLDQGTRQQGLFDKVNRFEITLDTRPPGRVVEMEIEYIKLRSAKSDEVYTTSEKPLPVPIKLDRPLREYPRHNNIFTFGVWGIPSVRFNDWYTPTGYRFDGGGMEVPFRNLRRNYCNAVLNPGSGGVDTDKTKEIRLLHDPSDRIDYSTYIGNLVRTAKKYGVYVMPMAGGAIPMGKEYNDNLLRKYVAPVIDRFGDCENILGWYMADEPPIHWRHNYLKGKEFVESRSPLQPALMLSCSKEHILAYSNLCQVVMTDCYPIEYPIYHKGKFLKRDPWRITDWCKWVNKYAPDSPHYLVLSCHDFWNQAYPTVEEIRLQTYLGLANGADGIYYFIYSYGPQWLTKYIDKTLFDPYGNPSELWAEIGRIGKKVSPIGHVLMMSKDGNSDSFAVSKTPKINTVAGAKPAIEGVARIKGDMTLFVLWNNDLYRQQSAVFKLKETSDTKRIYDLFTFEDLGQADQARKVFIEPGGGKVFAFCTSEQFEAIHSKALDISIDNELAIVNIDMETVQRNGVSINALQQHRRDILGDIDNTKNLRSSEAILAKGEILNQLEAIADQLEQTCRSDKKYHLAVVEIERLRRALGRMHRILAEKLEAPKVTMGRHLPNPFPVLQQPGRSYAEVGLLLSLAFREICDLQEEGKTRELYADAAFLADAAEIFSGQLSELEKHRPNEASLTAEVRKKLMGLVGDQWKYKILWLEKGNGVNEAVAERRKEADESESTRNKNSKPQ